MTVALHNNSGDAVITGHAGLNKHLHTMTLSNTDICPKCELEVETVDHFLSSCPAFSQLREDHFIAYYIDTTDIFEHFVEMGHFQGCST